VNERALFDALSNGDVRGAAIDVWYRTRCGQRDDGSRHASVRRTGQRADDAALVGGHHGHVRWRADDIAANIGRFARGETLRNVVIR